MESLFRVRAVLHTMSLEAGTVLELEQELGEELQLELVEVLETLEEEC